MVCVHKDEVHKKNAMGKKMEGTVAKIGYLKGWHNIIEFQDLQSMLCSGNVRTFESISL